MSGRIDTDPGERWMQLRPFVAILIVLTLITFAYQPMRPPPPVPADAPADAFSAERAFEHVQVIAKHPHPMGSEAIDDVRGYIVEQLRELGLEPDLQSIAARDYFSGTGIVDVVNIVARIPGTNGPSAVAFMAHYDTVPATPGANDNSAAVAALLELGRALRDGDPLANDVLLVFTDSEEPAPRFGSRAFVTENAAFEDIDLIVNLEASGGAGASILAETSGPQQWLVGELANAVSESAAFSFVTDMTRLFGELGTDFDPFREAGVPGFHFAYLHNSPIYHLAADNIESVDLGSLQHHGEYIVGIAHHFGNLDEQGSGDEALVFFRIGPRLLSYSLPIAVLLAVALAAALVLVGAGDRDRGGRVGIVRSLGRTAAVGLAVAVAATFAWMAVAALRQSPGVIESYAYLVLISVAAAYAATRWRPTGDQARFGFVIVWGVLALATAVWLPGFSYLFTWPGLAAAGALFWHQRTQAEGGLLRFTLVAAPTILLMTPAIDVFFQFSQPRPGNPDSQLTYAFLLPAVLVLLSAGLVGIFWPREAIQDRPVS